MIRRCDDGLCCRNTGPAQSPLQHRSTLHSSGPASASHSPLPDSWSWMNEEASPLLDRMDTECALRFACSKAVLRGMLQVRATFMSILQTFPVDQFAICLSRMRVVNVAPWCRRAPDDLPSLAHVPACLQLDRVDDGANESLFEGGSTYTQDGILKPQRLVARYSSLTRNNACLDLSVLMQH